jgi:hypothetical protein
VSEQGEFIADHEDVYVTNELGDCGKTKEDRAALRARTARDRFLRVAFDGK